MKPERHKRRRALAGGAAAAVLASGFGWAIVSSPAGAYDSERCVSVINEVAPGQSQRSGAAIGPTCTSTAAYCQCKNLVCNPSFGTPRLPVGTFQRGAECRPASLQGRNIASQYGPNNYVIQIQGRNLPIKASLKLQVKINNVASDWATSMTDGGGNFSYNLNLRACVNDTVYASVVDARTGVRYVPFTYVGSTKC
jgi:hypothetical protein